MNTRGQPWIGWTDEIFEAARVLYLTGVSCSKIAERLKIPSRNSVIGKMARMKVKRPGVPSKPKSTPRAHLREESRHDQVRSIPPPIVRDPIPPLGLTIMELRWPAETRMGTCRWPLGGTGDEMKYCGHDARGPYCDDHTKLAYQPQTEAQKRATVRAVTWLAR